MQYFFTAITSLKWQRGGFRQVVCPMKPAGQVDSALPQWPVCRLLPDGGKA